jgi:hypothetical protein
MRKPKPQRGNDFAYRSIAGFGLLSRALGRPIRAAIQAACRRVKAGEERHRPVLRAVKHADCRKNVGAVC